MSAWWDYILSHSQCVNMYYGYTYSVMRGYGIYNVHSRDSTGQIYVRLVKNSKEDK